MNYEKLWLEYQQNKEHIVLNEKMALEEIYILADVEDLQEVIAMNRAAEELKEAIQIILEVSVKIQKVTTFSKATNKGINLSILRTLKNEDAYQLTQSEDRLEIKGSNGRGLIYGVFHIIRRLQLNESLLNIDIYKEPDNPLRMLNHWDNMDGSIERGYSGESFFFKDNKIIINDRTRMYARFLASMGINGTVINNVNVEDLATELITDKYYHDLHRLMTLFDEYGIKLYLSLNYAASIEIGGLDTADPLDSRVIHWWESKFEEVYKHLPHLGGFVVKADSEGRVGPFDYGRNQAEGANMLGGAIWPHGGIIIWRCFVYNCQQDWRDQVTDRAKAGYDYFAPLDGQFMENVVLQIKNGPMDFQVREPVSPLFGGMKKTNQILEVQIAQEYTGQQRHVCYLIPMFKEILGFETYSNPTRGKVSDIISGKTYNHLTCGMATVCNTGNNLNWTGHDLAGVNLYGYGRLSYDTSLSAEEIAKEWIHMTFGSSEIIREVLLEILMKSRLTYEMYTSPLGIGWMVQPNNHYGPNVDGYEYSRWGTYHRADYLGIGVDRTMRGTGYSGQYNEPNATMYDNIETCPEELLLFFHHVPYTHRLSTGTTLIQHIYDTHFQGVEEVMHMIDSFKTLKEFMKEPVFKRILSRLEEQMESAIEWRDQINSYFKRKSGIDDEKNRVIY